MRRTVHRNGGVTDLTVLIIVNTAAIYIPVVAITIIYCRVVVDIAVVNHTVLGVNAHTINLVARTCTRQVDGIVVNLTVPNRAAVAIYGHAATGYVAFGAGDGRIVGRDDTVLEGEVFADIGTATLACGVHGAATDGKAIEHRSRGFGEVRALVQHTTRVGAEQYGLVHVGLCTVVEIVVRRLVAIESAIRMNIGFDFETVCAALVAGVGAFLHIEIGCSVGECSRRVHGLLQLHGVGPRGAVAQA